MGLILKKEKSVIYDYFGSTFYDELHSQLEYRFVMIGYSKNNRLLFVSYTDTDNNIRLISARKATKNER